MNISQALVAYMEKLGIDTIFGMPGAHILPVYDQLYDSPIQSVLVKHEQGAAFMAGGYARASGRIGACIATAGPGATNLITGIANAYAEQLPVLIITGETSTHIFGKGGLQESSGEGGSIDQVQLFSGITAYAKRIERSDYLIPVLNQCSRILLSSQPAPVLLTIPYNVQKEQIIPELLQSLVFPQPLPQPPHAQIPALVDLLRQAKAPVIVAGNGCLRAQAQPEIQQLSQKLNMPVATSLKAKGVIDEQSPLSLGSLGVTSDNRAYHYIVEQADLLLILGAGFNERTSYTWKNELLQNKLIVQIDHDPAQMQKVFQADLALLGDIKALLQQLIQALPDEPKAYQAQARRDPILQHPDFERIKALFARLVAAYPERLMIFDDNIILAQNYLPVSAQNDYFPNTGISSLGHAIPAAIGAKQARPEHIAIAIIGDGGFQMCAFEIMTAVNYQLPLTILLLNNDCMGLIRKNQYQHYQQRYIDCDFINPDYQKLAQSFGIEYYRIEQNTDIDVLIAGCDFEGQINLIEIPVDKNAFPNYRTQRD